MNSLTLIVSCASIIANGDAFTAIRPTILSSVSLPIRRVKKSIKVELLLDPVVAIDHVSNLHDHSEAFSNAGFSLPDSSLLTEVLSTTFLGIGKSASTSNNPTVEEMLSYTNGLKSAASNSALSAPEVFGLSGSAPFVQETPVLSEKDAKEAIEYIATDEIFMSKIPLAALTFVAFDFFIMNFQRVTSDDMYEYDDESYLEGTQSDTPEEIVLFAGQTAIRLVLLFVVVYLTAVVTQMTYQPNL